MIMLLLQLGGFEPVAASPTMDLSLIKQKPCQVHREIIVFFKGCVFGEKTTALNRFQRQFRDYRRGIIPHNTMSNVII
jgi:hypothetical protein